MKKSLLAFVIVPLLCACSSSMYYQLYKVDTNGLEQKTNQLSFENEHCTISYNLWGENGNLSFTMYNKTDQNIFIVMPQSFFIQNGMAYDYYSNAVHTSRQVTQVGKAATYANSYASMLGNSAMGVGKSTTYAGTLTSENSTSTQEMAVICIPPKAAKYFKGFKLIEQAHKDCDDYDFNYPKKQSDIITYDKEASPWAFRNRIAYTLESDMDNCLYVDNELWVSHLQNYDYKAMEEYIKDTECETHYTITKLIILNKAPNAFYNKYTKTIGAIRQSSPSTEKIDKPKDDLYSARWR